jgi:hypothetical protein
MLLLPSPHDISGKEKYSRRRERERASIFTTMCDARAKKEKNECHLGTHLGIECERCAHAADVLNNNNKNKMRKSVYK